MNFDFSPRLRIFCTKNTDDWVGARATLEGTRFAAEIDIGRRIACVVVPAIGQTADRLLRRRRQRPSVGKISAKCCSFSAVSAPIFARKYAFDSIFQALQNLHIFAPLQSQNFS